MTAPAEGEALQRLIERFIETAERYRVASELLFDGPIQITIDMVVARAELQAALAGPVDAQPKATIVGQELVPWTTSGVTDNGPAERVLAGPVDASGEPELDLERIEARDKQFGGGPLDQIAVDRHLLLAEVKRLRAAAVPSPPAQEIEHFWTAVRRGWDIEPRAYFEARAVAMGFKSPVEMAVHWMWKRHGKDWPAAAAPSECTCRTASCGHGASLHGVNGLCSVCKKECWS